MNRLGTSFSLSSAMLLMMFLVAGCTDNDSVLGSCDAGMASDKSKMCIDYYDGGKLSAWRSVCTLAMKGSWSDAACRTEEALGGCQLQGGHAVIWLYPSGKYQTPADVETFCTEKEGSFLQPEMK